MFRGKLKFRFQSVILSVLVILLLLELFVFIQNSIGIVSETNKKNFNYIVKARDASEEIDKIVERAEVNLKVVSSIIEQTYDISKISNKKYNDSFLKEIEVPIRAVLLNTPGVEGSWFQLNHSLYFSDKAYLWFTMKDGHILNYKNILEQHNPQRRELNPEDDSYYFEAVNNKTITWSDIYKDVDSGISMITISNPLYRYGKFIGVVGIDISVENLNTAINNIQKLIPDSDVFLLDLEENVILSKLQNQNFSTTAKNHISLKQLKNSTSREGISTFSDNGVSKTAIILNLSNKYNIVITFDNSDIFRGFGRLFKTIYFILSIMTFLIFLALLNSNKIKKINKQLGDESSKLRTIIDSSPNVILMKDLNGIYIDCNKTFLDFTGFKKEDFIGKKDSYFLNEEETAEVIENDRFVIESRKVLVKEGYYKNKHGDSICFEKFIIPLLDINNALTGLLVIGFDITKKKQQQEFLQSAKDNAEKIMTMKSNFLANMSHEIRTPMNGVLGFLQLLNETNPTPEQAEFIQDAQKASELLLQIINDILDFSKIEADKLKIDEVCFNIQTVVEDVTKMAVSQEKKGVLNISSFISSDIPQFVLGDPTRVKQVLSNIIGNAVKFTKEGEILLSVSLVSETDSSLILAFEVKDTGIGIDKDKLYIIFDEFTQADASTTRRFGGTGLGLAITKKLVNLMNGSISVISELGKGSIFTIQIPFNKDNTHQCNCSEKVSDGLSVLIVDSEPTNLRILDYYLRDANFIVHQARSHSEAFEAIRSKSISAILVDEKLGYIADKELSHVIKSMIEAKNIPLVLLSSLLKIGDSVQAKKRGFSARLSKPIKKQELIVCLMNVVSQKNKDCVPIFVNDSINLLSKPPSENMILVAEDSEINQKVIFRILNSYGFKCDIVCNGEEAVDAFKTNKYDLILMDCQMPILDGYEATVKIRQLENNRSHIPIVAMTANVMALDEKRCYEFGMDDYISKPVKLNILLKVLNKHLFLDKKSDLVIDEEFNDLTHGLVFELGFSEVEANALLKEFLDSVPDLINQLNLLIRSENFEELKKVNHKFKGATSNLRLNRFYELCLILDLHILKNNVKGCSQLLEELREYYLEINQKQVNPI